MVSGCLLSGGEHSYVLYVTFLASYVCSAAELSAWTELINRPMYSTIDNVDQIILADSKAA